MLMAAAAASEGSLLAGVEGLWVGATAATAVAETAAVVQTGAAAVAQAAVAGVIGGVGTLMLEQPAGTERVDAPKGAGRRREVRNSPVAAPRACPRA